MSEQNNLVFTGPVPDGVSKKVLQMANNDTVGRLQMYCGTESAQLPLTERN